MALVAAGGSGTGDDTAGAEGAADGVFDSVDWGAIGTALGFIGAGAAGADAVTTGAGDGDFD